MLGWVPRPWKANLRCCWYNCFVLFVYCTCVLTSAGYSGHVWTQLREKNVFLFSHRSKSVTLIVSLSFLFFPGRRKYFWFWRRNKPITHLSQCEVVNSPHGKFFFIRPIIYSVYNRQDFVPVGAVCSAFICVKSTGMFAFCTDFNPTINGTSDSS